MLACRRVHYRGRVQGVGFRYTTQTVARGFPVTGYVRNLSNGQVEVVAEGEADKVDAFLNAVGERLAGYIEGQDVEDIPPEGCREFGIRV
jgi:acylphosphatase